MDGDLYLIDWESGDARQVNDEVEHELALLRSQLADLRETMQRGHWQELEHVAHPVTGEMTTFEITCRVERTARRWPV